MVTSSSSVVGHPPIHSATPPPKDALDLIAEYTDSTSGAWDLFYIVDHALSYVHMIPAIPWQGNRKIAQVREFITTIGLALSVPQLISDCNKLRQSVIQFFDAQKPPQSDPLQQRRVVQASKNAFLSTLTVANTLTYIPYLLDHLRIRLFETAHLKVFDGFYHGTSVIIDGVDLVGEGYKLNNYYSTPAEGLSRPQKELLEQRKSLAWMYVATDVASVAISVIALTGLIFGFAVEGFGVIAVSVLTLSTIWLSIKIASYFYEQAVVVPNSNAILASAKA